MKAENARLKRLVAELPWTSRCSRRSPQKSGDGQPTLPGRASAPADLRRIAASLLLCPEATPLAANTWGA